MDLLDTGCKRTDRRAYWRETCARAPRLLVLESDERGDGGGSERGNDGRQKRRAAEHGQRPKIGADVPRSDFIEQSLEQPRHGERGAKSQHEADRDQSQPVADDKSDDMAGLRARGPTDGDFLVLCPTMYASTLKIPTAASSAATPANSPSTCVRNRGYANATSNNSAMLSNRTGTVGFASCKSARRVVAIGFSSTEVRARMDNELPQSCVDGTNSTGGGG